MRHDRLCTLCKSGLVEDEEHFLLKCDVYNPLKIKYKFDQVNEASVFFTEANLDALGRYLIEAFETRERLMRINREGQGDKDEAGWVGSS